MRNLFDQFTQQENRLTHALMSSLHEDRALLRGFIKWATGESAPAGDFLLKEQSLAGGEESEELTAEQGRGLPDGWISNEKGWALLIESKIACRLEADQIRRHRLTAQRRGFNRPYILALVTEEPERPLDPELRVRRWSQLYTWLKNECLGSQWARKLREYMEIFEAKLVKDEYLKDGALTVFSGVPFGKKSPYNYLEAKRVLRLAMDELRIRQDLHKAFGIDPDTPGRPAITGIDSMSVWDYIGLGRSAEAKSFTEFPHLGLDLHRAFMNAAVVVPNGLRSDFRRRLLGQDQESFRGMFSDILTQFDQSFKGVEGAVPWVVLVQRRYPSLKSEPFIDAMLEFDLRTAFPAANSTGKVPKLQSQWLRSIYDAMKHRKANLQLAIGVRFAYDRCSDIGTRKILNHIAHAWITCTPLVNHLLDL